MTAPLICPQRTVERAWIDYNGHMNMAYYNVVFDQALDHVFDRLGIGADYVNAGRGSVFTAEIHVTYLRELKLGDPLLVTFQLLDWDDKRIHYFEEMSHARDGYLAATSEQIGLHVDLTTRKAAPFPIDVQPRIDALMRAHRELPRSDRVGHVMGVPPEKSKRLR